MDIRGTKTLIMFFFSMIIFEISVFSKKISVYPCHGYPCISTYLKINILLSVFSLLKPANSYHGNYIGFSAPPHTLSLSKAYIIKECFQRNMSRSKARSELLEKMRFKCSVPSFDLNLESHFLNVKFLCHLMKNISNAIELSHLLLLNWKLIWIKKKKSTREIHIDVCMWTFVTH